MPKPASKPPHGVERLAPDRPVGAVHLGPSGEVLVAVPQAEDAEERLHPHGRPAGGALGGPQRLDRAAGDGHPRVAERVAQALDPAGGRTGVVVQIEQQAVAGRRGARVAGAGEAGDRLAHDSHAGGQAGGERLDAVVDHHDLASGREHAVGDAGIDARAHLVGAVARAHDHACRRALARAADAGIGDDGEALGCGRDQRFLMALARACKRLALHPPVPSRGQAVERERVRLGLTRGQRPQAAVGAEPVAVDVAGAGLEHRRGQAGAGRDGRDERRDEPGPRPSDRGKRDAHLGRRRLGGGSEGRPAPDRAVGAMDRDVALEAREQRPRLRAGGIVDDDDLDVLGQVAGDQRLDLGPERGRVVAGDDQDGCLVGAHLIALRRVRRAAAPSGRAGAGGRAGRARRA